MTDSKALVYNDKDIRSILEHASKLKDHSLSELLENGEEILGGTNTKGKFGQLIESGYFLIDNNNSPLPDFHHVGVELKVSPFIKNKDGAFKPKERLILGILDYMEVPKRGFDIFMDKDSHLLIVFYEWKKNTDIRKYKVIKVVDWTPDANELHLIKEDWKVIEHYVNHG